MPSQLEMLERWTKFARRRCQFETRERESEGEEVKMKQMKAEELAAFDLDFFEEIEDLKYKYAEATQRLRTYEGGI